MEKYNKDLADNPKVVMIHLSSDQDEESAEKWAAKESFPWLTILPDDVERSGLAEYRTRNVVPFYVMVDKDGNPVAEGADGCFAKAAELKEKDKA